MIRAIIIDDEPNARKLLKQLIQRYFHSIEVIGMADSIESGIATIKKSSPDLVFLDVEMPLGSGFELLNRIDIVDFEVIFVIAFDQYAIKAFKFDALYYLVKPIDLDELSKAVQKAEKKILNKLSMEPKLPININKNPYNKLPLPTKDGLKLIQISKIIRCESDINYTWFYLENDEKVLASRTLKEFDDILIKYNFFRVHKSHLINLNHLREYIKGEGGTAIMSDKSEIQVSRRNKETFLNTLCSII